MPERTQSMDWFGEPWPSEDQRAPVCEDDDYRVPVPVGELCSICAKPFVDTDRGITMPYLRAGGNTFASFHASCFVGSILYPGGIRNL